MLPDFRIDQGVQRLPLSSLHSLSLSGLGADPCSEWMCSYGMTTVVTRFLARWVCEQAAEAVGRCPCWDFEPKRTLRRVWTVSPLCVGTSEEKRDDSAGLRA